MTKKKTRIKDVSIKFVGYDFACPECRALPTPETEGGSGE